jgi:outer membrane protein
MILQRALALGLMVGAIVVSVPTVSYAIDVVHEGTAQPGEIVAGFRVGPGFSTTPALNTVGPSLNFQGLYGVNKWLRMGMVLDWDQHKIDKNVANALGTSGSFSTITILPVYLEYRPGRIGGIQPYVATGIGVNINNKQISNTMAWRAAGGIDYFLTKALALNTEVKYTRNTTDGADLGGVALLFGVRYSFGR